MARITFRCGRSNWPRRRPSSPTRAGSRNERRGAGPAAFIHRVAVAKSSSPQAADMSSILVQVIVGGLLLGAVYALFSSGLTLMWGMMKIASFAHGGFVMRGMCVAFG